MADADEPAEPLADGLGQLAFCPCRALRELFLGQEIEGGDMTPANPRKGVFPSDRSLGDDQSLLESGKPGLPSSRSMASGVGNRTRSISRIEGKYGFSQ